MVHLKRRRYRNFLTQAKRIYDAEISGISESDMEDFLESNRSRGMKAEATRKPRLIFPSVL